MKHKVAHESLRDWLNATGTTQTELGEKLGITRAAVSKYCSGDMAPSKSRARQIERISMGAIPATLWPRRPVTEPQSKGARVLLSAIERRRMSIMQVARDSGLPVRALHRWVVGDNAPRKSGLAKLNTALGLKLTQRDFEVRA